MPWLYSQSTGRLTQGRQYVATGYSGHGAGRNNAAMAAAHGIGPTPLERIPFSPDHSRRS